MLRIFNLIVMVYNVRLLHHSNDIRLRPNNIVRANEISGKYWRSMREFSVKYWMFCF